MLPLREAVKMMQAARRQRLTCFRFVPESELQTYRTLSLFSRGIGNLVLTVLKERKPWQSRPQLHTFVYNKSFAKIWVCISETPQRPLGKSNIHWLGGPPTKGQTHLIFEQRETGS